MRLLFWITRILVIFTLSAPYAKPIVTEFAHDFWLPYYHKKRLNYCLADQQTCGMPVANLYCQQMGYDKAEKATKDHNIGMAAYLNQKQCCLGWTCAGFKLIRCTVRTPHKPERNYYYRYKKFVLPRLDHYRIAWCYQSKKECGKRAAYSFCRRMGYEKATQFHMEDHLAATKALGNQALCFKDCKGFSSIVCYR